LARSGEITEPPRSPVTDRHDPVFENARLEPFLDQADHARVIDPVLQKTDQPFLADRVEKAPKIRIENMVPFLRVIPTMSASSASCWLRFGRNPYENPRKSSS